MKDKQAYSETEAKRKALYEKAGKPTAQMKQELGKSFGLLQQDEMKGYDAAGYKTAARRK